MIDLEVSLFDEPRCPFYDRVKFEGMDLLTNLRGERKLNVLTFYHMDSINGCMIMYSNRKVVMTFDLQVG